MLAVAYVRKYKKTVFRDTCACSGTVRICMNAYSEDLHSLGFGLLPDCSLFSTAPSAATVLS